MAAKYTLNAITAPDAYGVASTIEVPLSSVRLDVSNQAIYYQEKLDLYGGQGVWDTTETFMYPGSLPLRRSMAGIRIRAAVPLASIPAGGIQAVVTIEGMGPDYVR